MIIAAIIIPKHNRHPTKVISMPGLALPFLLPELHNPAFQFKKYLNFLLSLMARRRGAIALVSKPFDLSINPSTACQLACPYCETGNGKMARPAINLSPALHRHMISGLAEALFVIRYFGTGESLLNKRFSELLRDVKGKEIFTFITSNLSLKLTDKQIDQLLLSGLNLLGVSLDGIEQETYGQYRVGGSHDLVVDNLCRLVQRKKQLGLSYPLIQWRYLVFKHNVHEVKDVRRLAAQYEVDLLEFVKGVGPRDDDGMILGPDEFDIFPTMSGPALQAAKKSKNTLLYRLMMGSKAINRLPPGEIKHHKCDWHYMSSYWYPDGGVGPCCIATDIKQDFGKVTPNKSFSDVWNDKRYSNARALFSEGKHSGGLCENCKSKGIMDRYFNAELRGILWNAPAWVLKILSVAPDLFFLPIDHYYLSAEIQAITDNQQEFSGTYDDIGAVLRCVRDSDISKEPYLRPLIDLLADPVHSSNPTLKQRWGKIKGSMVYGLKEIKTVG